MHELEFSGVVKNENSNNPAMTSNLTTNGLGATLRANKEAQNALSPVQARSSVQARFAYAYGNCLLSDNE